MSADPTSPRDLGGAPELAALLEKTLLTESLDCVHCGLCLTSCPTYRATGRETASPRGRIYLMRGLAEGRLADPQLLEEEAFVCLGCRACETACPSGVRYGEMLEHTRAALRASKSGFDLAVWIERFALRQIIPNPRRLRLLVSLLGLVQKLRLDRLAALVLPRRLADMTRLLPTIPPANERSRMPRFTPALGPRRGRVALFEGCMMPEFFGRVNEAARLVLSRAGYDVVVPEGQGCCGALQAHSGDLAFAHELAAANARAFDRHISNPVTSSSSGTSSSTSTITSTVTPSSRTSSDASNEAGNATPAGSPPGLGKIDAIIVTSAGCSAAMREADHWLGAAGGTLAGGVRDVLEFLDEVDVALPMKPLAKRVCYDDPCHLIHAQGISAAPRRLLRAIPELELIPHRNPEACCGAAGIYNLTQPAMSARVLAPKVEALVEAAPEVVATANPGCAMQLAAGLAASGMAVEVVHPIELIEQATR